MNYIKETLDRINIIPGVLAAHELNEAHIIQITKLEKMAEKNGAASGMMEFVNKGVWESLNKEHVLLIVADSDAGFREPPEPWTVMVDEKGTIVGEWIQESRIEEYKKKDNVQFLGNDFVIYTDRPRQGKVIFLMPAMPFPELDELAHIKNVKSGCVSAPADMYLKKTFDVTGNYWTILIGFDAHD